MNVHGICSLYQTCTVRRLCTPRVKYILPPRCIFTSWPQKQKRPTPTAQLMEEHLFLSQHHNNCLVLDPNWTPWLVDCNRSRNRRSRPVVLLWRVLCILDRTWNIKKQLRNSKSRYKCIFHNIFRVLFVFCTTDNPDCASFERKTCFFLVPPADMCQKEKGTRERGRNKKGLLVGVQQQVFFYKHVCQWMKQKTYQITGCIFWQWTSVTEPNADHCEEKECWFEG